ncbi:galactoside alpha-(1,2)-fucosyltransferase 1-like isoform X2 [Mytilus trossulus]|uniref:galactoside alpha-(1,2)-fucosyltransferase 1-like isoform X2 n=1 Tax=Mytilus trossulus TaxID=6551 RepID=UPI0030054CDB
MGSSWRIVSCFFSSIRFVYVKMVHINVWNISGHCHRLLQNRTARKLAVICMLLTGFFQSWRYWKHYENELRQILQFQDNILHEAKSQFHNILSKHKNYQGITTIGVHIRRFERYDTDEFGKNNAPKEYIIHAMDYFRNLYKKCLFLIFSIKMKWTKKNIPQTDDIFLVEGNSAPVDLAMLTLTNHTIMTVGTFGWMAGWMTQGKTVYYKHPDTPGSEFSKLYSNYSDHFYPGWIPME